MTDMSAHPGASTMTNTNVGQWIWCTGEDRTRDFTFPLRRTFEPSTDDQGTTSVIVPDSGAHLFKCSPPWHGRPEFRPRHGRAGGLLPPLSHGFEQFIVDRVETDQPQRYQ